MKQSISDPSRPAENRALEKLLERLGPIDAFETLAGLLPDAAVFVVDAERNVVLWSDGAERVLGFSRKEVLGRLCLVGIHCRNCMIGCGLAQHGDINGYPLELFRNDQQVVATRKYARGFFTEDGSFAGGIEVLMPTGPAFAPEAHEIGLPPDAEQLQNLVSRDPAMKRAFQVIRHVAETDTTVLVRGESGSGKELVARALHAESRRRDHPFIAVNCAALTVSLIESELFGHEKGAFTGASARRDGLFAQANGGTLFLDEISELPLEAQAKLLRVLEDQVVTRVGGNETFAVDVRVIAATHRSLREEVKSGRFREDLMYRLRVVPIFIPALRDRLGEVELLLQRFLEEFNARGPRFVAGIAPEAMRTLLDHTWPGNVRELRNVVQYAFAVGRGAELLVDELPPELRGDVDGTDGLERTPPLDSTLQTDEAASIRRALEVSGGRIGDAAALLGISRPTLWRRRKRLGI